MIEVRDLTKVYGSTRAVDHLTFTVEPGRVTGFLGPNGAGKSTTMRMVLGLDRPTAGTATIGGRRYDELAEPLRVVGALLEARAVHTGRTARDHLRVLAETQGLPRTRVDEVLELVGLREAARRRAGGFSLGMGQRLGIAAALLGDPQVLVLDEPVNGLDPEGILWIRTLLQHLAREGRTVFVSSHLMSEMSLTAAHLVVIGRGALIADSSTAEFIARSTGLSVLVRSPDASALRTVLAGEGAEVDEGGDGALVVRGLDAAAGRGARRAAPARAARARAADRLARGGVHGADPRQRRVHRSGGVMTTATAPRVQPRAGGPAFGRLLRSEWTKLRSVRSTVWSLVLLVVLVLGFTGLFMGLTVGQWDQADPTQRALLEADPTGQILGAGFFLGQLSICVLGVLVITSEYSTGMIRASLLAVPRRVPMLLAKVVVFGALVLVLGELVSFASFALGSAILSSRVSVSLGDPGVLRAVIGAGLYLAVLGVFSLAVGAVVRHTAAAITGVIGFVLVLAPLAQLLPGTLGDRVHAYLPTEAGHLIAQARQAPGDLLSPWQGFGVFVAWTAALLVLAAVLLRRRDA